MIKCQDRQLLGNARTVVRHRNFAFDLGFSQHGDGQSRHITADTVLSLISLDNRLRFKTFFLTCAQTDAIADCAAVTTVTRLSTITTAAILLMQFIC